MTDPVRDAAQALVDRIDRGRKEYQEAWPDDDAELDALRRALASPAPSTSRDDAPWAERRRAAWEDGWRAACDYWAKECANTARNAARKPARDEASGWAEAIRSRRDMPEPRRSLKGQPPPAAPADQSKETP